MESKSELLVFSKKEITVIIVLLGLVSLFSFTLGLKLGRNLGVPKPLETTEPVPLVEKAPEKSVVTKAPEAAEPPTPMTGAKGEEAKTAEDAAADKADDRADAELSKAISNEKVGLKKPIPMAIPNETVGSAPEGVRFTLQFGSYRTVAEAAEQVSALKHGQLQGSALDVFYFETNVPGKGTWYRVGAGSYPTKESADVAAVKLKAQAKSLPPFFVQRITQ